MRARRVILAIVAAILAGAVLAAWIGARRQDRALAAQVDRLMRQAQCEAFSLDELSDSVPPPVARYLRWALPRRQPIRFVRIGQAGTLRTDPRGGRWMSFEAEHLATPRGAAFLWNARVAVAPLLHVRVRDAFIQGEGSGTVSLLSAFPVGHDAGSREMNSGSLHRFLAEAAWYPTALIPGSRLRWTAIDASAALATMTVGDVSVSLEFRFAGTGEIAGIYTPARWGTFDGGYEQRAWEGHFRNYQQRDGIRVPTEGEVGWYVDGEWAPVWRGTVRSFEAVPCE